MPNVVWPPGWVATAPYLVDGRLGVSCICSVSSKGTVAKRRWGN